MKLREIRANLDMEEIIRELEIERLRGIEAEKARLIEKSPEPEKAVSYAEAPREGPGGIEPLKDAPSGAWTRVKEELKEAFVGVALGVVLYGVGIGGYMLYKHFTKPEEPVYIQPTPVKPPELPTTIQQPKPLPKPQYTAQSPTRGNGIEKKAAATERIQKEETKETAKGQENEVVAAATEKNLLEGVIVESISVYKTTERGSDILIFISNTSPDTHDKCPLCFNGKYGIISPNSVIRIGAIWTNKGEGIDIGLTANVVGLVAKNGDRNNPDDLGRKFTLDDIHKNRGWERYVLENRDWKPTGNFAVGDKYIIETYEIEIVDTKNRVKDGELGRFYLQFYRKLEDIIDDIDTLIWKSGSECAPDFLKDITKCDPNRVCIKLGFNPNRAEKPVSEALLKEALSLSRRAAEIYPNSSLPHNRADVILKSLAELLHNPAYYSEALKEAKKAIETEPQDSVFKSNLGVDYWKVGDCYNAALNLMGIKALKLNLMKIDWRTDAKDVLDMSLRCLLEEEQKKLEQNPNDATLNYNVGTFYLRLGECEDAVRYLKKSLKLNPHNTKVSKNLEEAKECKKENR